MNIRADSSGGEGHTVFLDFLASQRICIRRGIHPISSIYDDAVKDRMVETHEMHAITNEAVLVNAHPSARDLKY
jgi:hypothetical protein